jgi:hypothetical protein
MSALWWRFPSKEARMEKGEHVIRFAGIPEAFVSGSAADSVEHAIQAAYENAKHQFPGKRTFRVVDIYVTGENPVTGYSVVLGTTG